MIDYKVKSETQVVVHTLFYTIKIFFVYLEQRGFFFEIYFYDNVKLDEVYFGLLKKILGRELKFI